MRLERVLIVDDEPPARRLLARALHDLADVGEVVDAGTVDAAVRALATTCFDVVFLDVHVPRPDGFAVFERGPVRAPVIFVTAYDRYAVRAFEVAAVDYLLKPIERARLETALARLGRAPQPDVVCLRDRTRQQFVRVDQIAWIAAADDYTEVHLDDGTSPLCSLTMTEWEARLPAEQFVRIHRSTIVRLADITGVTRSATLGTHVHLRDGRELRVARTYVATLVARLPRC